jgi:hypothetical protein
MWKEGTRPLLTQDWWSRRENVASTAIKLMNRANRVVLEVNELRPELKVESSRGVEDCDVTPDEVEAAMRSLARQRRSFGPASVAFSRPGVRVSLRLTNPSFLHLPPSIFITPNSPSTILAS